MSDELTDAEHADLIYNHRRRGPTCIVYLQNREFRAEAAAREWYHCACVQAAEIAALREQLDNVHADLATAEAEINELRRDRRATGAGV